MLLHELPLKVFVGVWDSCTCECLRFLLAEDHEESAEKMLRTEVEKLVSETLMNPKVQLTITAPDFKNLPGRSEH